MKKRGIKAWFQRMAPSISFITAPTPAHQASKPAAPATAPAVQQAGPASVPTWPPGDFDEKYRPIERRARLAVVVAMREMKLPPGSIVQAFPFELRPDYLVARLRRGNDYFTTNANLAKFQDALVRAADSEEIEVSLSAASLVIKIWLPVDRERKVRLAEIKPGSVGLTERLQNVYIRFEDDTRFAIKVSGVPGAGKSYLGRAILLATLRTTPPAELGLMVACPKASESPFAAFAGAPHLVAPIGATKEAAESLVIAWCNEILRRDRGGEFSGKLMLVIDEAQVTLEDEQVRALLGRTIRVGRSAGAVLVYMNQINETGKESHSKITDLIKHAVTGAAASAQKAAILAGRGNTGAHRLGGSGSFVLTGGVRDIQFKAVWTEDSEIESIIGQMSGRPPLLMLDTSPAVLPGRVESEIDRGGRPELPLPAAVAAVPVAYQDVFGKPLGKRQAQKLGIKTTLWKKALEFADLERQVNGVIVVPGGIRARVAVRLRRMVDSGEISSKGIVQVKMQIRRSG